LLKLGRASDDYADIDRSQIEKQSKVIEVPVEERILVVPLQFECDAPLEAINLVGRALVFDSVNFDRCLKLLFDPAKSIESAVNLLRDRRLAAARRLHLRPQ